MASAGVQIRGLERLQRQLAALPGQVRRGGQEAEKAEAEHVAELMRDAAPVDSGELVDGIRADESGGRSRAVSTAPHSWPVESGTSTTPAQPFARPAADAARADFPRRVREDIRAELPT